MNTFMGQFFFGVDHTNRLSCVFLQFVNGSRLVIGPPLAQFEDKRVIYPFPTWQERTFEPQFNGTDLFGTPLTWLLTSCSGYSSEWAFFALALFFSLVSVAFIIFTAVKRNSPIIKYGLQLSFVTGSNDHFRASSPNLLFAFLVGSILLYSSLFTWTLTNVTAAGCYLQSWLLSFGFTIMFGYVVHITRQLNLTAIRALFAKSWRVFKLLQGR